MRKRFKIKHRSCGLCKPHKRGLAHRWKPHDQQAMREAEREMAATAGAGLARGTDGW